jgi:crossover junction endodeoxyribonuclease RuvC
MTLILGVDPGSIKLGYGVLEFDRGTLRYLRHGTFCAPRGEALHRRLARLYQELSAVLEDISVPEDPTAIDVALEKVFVARNSASALTLGQARGMILLAVGQRGCGLAEYTPAAIKKAVTGNGKASKQQVAAMVGRILGIHPAGESFDGTDALATAMCHAAHLQTERSLAGQLGR